MSENTTQDTLVEDEILEGSTSSNDTTDTVETVKTTDIKPKRGLKEWFVRIGLLVIGIMIVHLGVALFLSSGFGVDSFTIFVEGVAISTGISVGTSHIIIAVIMTVGIFFWAKGYVKIGTILCATISGPFLDLFNFFIQDMISVESPLVTRIIAFAIGLLLIGLGIPAIIKSDAGTSCYDLIGVILEDKNPKIQYRFVRMSTDIVLTIIGFMLGGQLGIGTVISAFAIGPLVQLFMPLMGKVTDKALKVIE